MIVARPLGLRDSRIGTSVKKSDKILNKIPTEVGRAVQVTLFKTSKRLPVEKTARESNQGSIGFPVEPR